MRSAALALSLLLAAVAHAEAPLLSDRPTVTTLKPSAALTLPSVEPLPQLREQDALRGLGPALAELVIATQTSTRLGRLQEQTATGARDGCPNARCANEGW